MRCQKVRCRETGGRKEWSEMAEVWKGKNMELKVKMENEMTIGRITWDREA